MKPGTVIAERFRIERLAGTGGMGAVYQAFDLQGQRHVAVKLARQTADHDFLNRFSREARALSEQLADLRHPGIVGYVAHGATAEGQPYLVMQWLKGQELKRRIAQAPLDEAETALLGRKICSALAAAHGRGVLHRDIKPSNLFLVEGDPERVTLIDFGLARLDVTVTMATQSGRLLGTPGFMAPEQARGRRDIDARVDLYSLGAVLFACLTQRPPFTGDHLMAVLAQLHLEEAPRVRQLREDVSLAMDELIARLLARNPDQRPRSAEEVAWALDTMEPGPSPGPVAEVALSRGEQRFSSVLLMGPDPDQTDLLPLAAHYNAKVEHLGPGTVVCFAAGVDPTAAATRAARFALAARARCASVPMVLATGRSVVGEHAVMGEVLERAASLLPGAEATLNLDPVEPSGSDSTVTSDIIVDEVTARLLDGRFEIHTRPGGGRLLVGERQVSSPAIVLPDNPVSCVGRDFELAMLRASFEQCVSEGTPRAVLITGAPGAGKSRVAQELVQELYRHDEPLRVWAGHGDSHRSGAPFGQLSELLRNAMRVPRGAPLNACHAAIESHVAARVDAGEAERVAVFLGEIMGAPFSDQDRVQLREARDDARLMNDQMQRAWLDWLDAETRDSAVLCVLDDAQWGDLATIRFVDSALRTLCDRPLMVLALARPEIHERFPGIWAARGLQQLALKPLSRRACAALIEQLGGGALADDEVARLAVRSNGNPFYAEELVRHAAGGQTDALPPTVLAMVGARLAALPPEERQVLRAASVLGPVFRLDALASLVARPVNTIEGLVERLAERELVIRQSHTRAAGERDYGFQHELIREAAYASLTEADRKNAHRRAGEWLDSQGTCDAVSLAEHFWRGERRDRALPWFHRAAEQALEADDLSAVVEWAERALACGAKGRRLGALRLLQAEALNWSQAHTAAYARAHEAMQCLPEGGSQWAQAAHHVAWAASQTGDEDVLIAVADQLMRHAPDNQDAQYTMAMGHCTTMLACYRHMDHVSAMMELIKSWAADTGSHLLRATLMHMKGYLASVNGHPDEAAEWCMQAIEQWNAAGNQRKMCLDEGNLAALLSELGLYQQSVGILRSSVALARRMGLESLLQDQIPNLALALAKNGDIAQARAVYRELELAEGNPRSQAQDHLYGAQLALLATDAPVALREAEAALALLDGGEHLDTQCFAHAVRARALLALDRPGDALAAARRGVDLLESIGVLEEGEALLRLVYAEALHATGAHGAARQAMAAARDRLLAKAERITRPEWRQSFLDNVAENRRALDLARAWAVDDPRAG